MYICIENEYMILLKDIIAVTSYEEFINSEEAIEFFEANRKKIIDMSKNKKKSAIITDKYIYISSYTTRALYSRGNEYENIKSKIKWR